jgi:lipopolysaccharide export system protein LptA
MACFVFAQTPVALDTLNQNKIRVEHADFFDVDEDKLPEAAILTGNVRVFHDGSILTCNKAYLYRKANIIKCFGQVNMTQKDTLNLRSKYGEYDGNTKLAYAKGDVIMTTPSSVLTTEVLNFDRNTQQATYSTGATIKNSQSTLVSQKGKYLAYYGLFEFRDKVMVTNPQTKIETNILDYYENSGHAYLFGKSKITNKDGIIETEKGMYDTKLDKANFDKNTKIFYNDRLIEGDFIYYDKAKEFATATRNVKITDTINKLIVTGHYAEIYQKIDSAVITRRALGKLLVEKDTMYTHARRLVITGKEGQRVFRGYDNARFFKTDMAGKCDSIHGVEKTGLTKLIGNPIIWNFENQMTGDLMHLIANTKTEKLDSLKVFNNVFIISKDTIGTGYNQVKGVFLNGRFENDALKEADVIKNTEVVYYMRDEQQALIGINKNVSSKINMIFEENEVDEITFFDNVEGNIYPEDKLHEKDRLLKGFIWRGDERIKSLQDLFIPEEEAYHQQMLKDTERDKKKEEEKPD